MVLYGSTECRIEVMSNAYYVCFLSFRRNLSCAFVIWENQKTQKRFLLNDKTHQAFAVSKTAFLRT